MRNKLQNWINWILYDELIDGKINAPKHLLGNHDYGDGQVITCYKPHSQSVSIKTPKGKTSIPMEKINNHLEKSKKKEEKREQITLSSPPLCLCVSVYIVFYF